MIDLTVELLAKSVFVVFLIGLLGYMMIATISMLAAVARNRWLNFNNQTMFNFLKKKKRDRGVGTDIYFRITSALNKGAEISRFYPKGENDPAYIFHDKDMTVEVRKPDMDGRARVLVSTADTDWQPTDCTDLLPQQGYEWYSGVEGRFSMRSSNGKTFIKPEGLVRLEQKVIRHTRVTTAPSACSGGITYEARSDRFFLYVSRNSLTLVDGFSYSAALVIDGCVVPIPEGDAVKEQLFELLASQSETQSVVDSEKRGNRAWDDVERKLNEINCHKDV